jgi:MFS family permease
MPSATPRRDPLFTGPFFRLWIFTFVTFFTAFQLFPTIPLRIIELGGSTAAAGRFLAIYTWACAIAAPITGTVADHVGRRRALVAAAVAFIVFSVLYGVTTWRPLLLVFASIHGIFWSALISSSAAILSEIVPFSRRTEGIAYWGMANTAAIAVAPMVGLTLYRHGWFWVAALMTALSCGMLILSLRVRGGTHQPAAPFPRASELVDWRVILLALGLFVMSYSYGGITSYVAIFAARQKIEPQSLFFTVFAIAILLTRIVTSPLGDRFGPLKLLYPSWPLVPAGLTILALAETPLQLSVAAFLFGAGFGAAYPAFVTYVFGRTAPERRGATFGSILFAFDMGIGSGSLITGMLVQRSGFPAAFGTAAVLSALSIPLFFITSKLLFASQTSTTAAGRKVSRLLTVTGRGRW